MNPHGLASLDLVQRFLASQVLSVVPNEIRSELRAAIKILSEARLELDGLYPMLIKESNELLQLCSELEAAAEIYVSPMETQKLSVLDRAFKKGFVSLTELLRFRDELNTLVAELTTLLQATENSTNRVWLEHFYRLLSEHASARLHWQSVFDRDGGR